jgi:ABC-type dipeptide/oligopeptide/nickel transport system ATPase subunit
MDVLQIKPIKTNKSQIKLNPLMQDCTIPKFPQSVLMVGASSSGKTTLLMNLMTKKEMYKGYHDFVFLFSVTAKLDDSFKPLKVKKDFIFDTEEDMIKNLKIIFESQKKNVEKEGVDKAPKMLLIFEDLTTNDKLMRDKIFKSLFTLGRHLNMQVIVMIHKYKALPRTQRLNAMNIIYFAGSKDEQGHLVDDFTPPRYSKKEFTEIVEYATSPDDNSKHNFLYICNKLPFKIKFRKNFDLILELDK